MAMPRLARIAEAQGAIARRGAESAYRTTRTLMKPRKAPGWTEKGSVLTLSAYRARGLGKALGACRACVAPREPGSGFGDDAARQLERPRGLGFVHRAPPSISYIAYDSTLRAAAPRHHNGPYRRGPSVGTGMMARIMVSHPRRFAGTDGAKVPLGAKPWAAIAE